ncbi:DUF5320 domain-containing protein [Chromobacterium phragmitis]|uniref:DUF5320 domain-containing protein n=1 Tax=Chromobacterium amazonense TaxID=1382803 RepID=UPI0021B70D0A|nr:DUF5320 domain-containing protein [Chromobacterium amazonense]MBM2884055.1 DUF5320 domain-containing protein [Chromobacterium amazonense]
MTHDTNTQLANDAGYMSAQVHEMGQEIERLRAIAEQVEQLESQLETADRRIKELETALTVARLPPESRKNVIQMVEGKAA